MSTKSNSSLTLIRMFHIRTGGRKGKTLITGTSRSHRPWLNPGSLNELLIMKPNCLINLVFSSDPVTENLYVWCLSLVTNGIALNDVTPLITRSTRFLHFDKLFQATKHASEGSILAFKSRGEVSTSPKQGYQRPTKRTDLLQKFTILKFFLNYTFINLSN